MANCVNRSSKEFQDLAEQTNLNPVILAAKISLWQKENGLENFPRAEEITTPAVMSQINTIQQSKATAEEVRVMRHAAESMGINIVELTEYAKGNPAIETNDVNGVADLMMKTIGVATGMENVALTEEVIHIGSAMMEQTHPKLITEMISKIDRYKIYKIVYDEYSKLKAYQLPNGKPDIRKIKKEAVDKLIAEVYLNPDPSTAQYPELLEEEPKSFARKCWETIVDALRRMYRKSDIDIYKKAGATIASGELDASIVPKEKGIYYQAAENVAVNNIFDKFREFGVDTELVDELLDAQGQQLKKRHYLYKGIEALQSVTEKVKAEMGKKFNRTEEQQKIDEQKRDWGSKGHALIENFLPTIIDKTTGYKRENPLPDNVTAGLTPSVEKNIKDYITAVVNSYPEGTRFIFEERVINTKVSGMMGGTVDFIAIAPTKTKDGLDDVKVDVLDWKFTSLMANQKEDLPWFKKKEWVAQMSEYTKILYNYGLNRNQLRRARMIPFIMNYEYNIPGNAKSGLVPKSIEIGKLDNALENNLYLLPVPIPSESTGNPVIDDLIKSLSQQYDKMYKEYVDPEEKDAKDHKLNEINKAIRNLQLKLNFEPLVKVATDFIDSAARDIKEYEKIDYDNISPEELKKVLADMLSFLTGSIKYQSLDSVYLSQYTKAGMTPEQKEIFNKLEDISSRARRMVKVINAVQTQAVISLAVKEDIDLPTIEDIHGTELIAPEIPINSLDKNFAEAIRLNAKLVQLMTKMAVIATKETNQKYVEEMSKFRELVVPLEKIAKGKAFNMIGTITPSGLRLIRKFDSKFWEELRANKAAQEKAKIMANMDMEKFNALAEEAIKKQTEYLEKVHWSSDEQENDAIKTSRITMMKNSIDINRSTFDGYESYKFNQILNQVLKEEGNLSKEYTQMTKTPEALAVWDYLTALNVEAKQMGYLSKNHSTAFFPLIEATTIQKIAQSGDFFGQLWRSVKDMGITDIDEKQNLSKIDAETGEPRLEIPKYFTSSNKQVSELSTDLSKVGSLWIKSLLDYKKAEALESTLLTIQAVEESKGGIVVDPQNRIIEEGGVPRVSEKNPNAEITKTILKDFLYGLREDLGSVGNIKIASAVGKFKKEEEAKEAGVVNVKKGLKTANQYIQAMGVGLKPLIGLANAIGLQLHAYINSGVFYKGDQFQRNHVRAIASNSLSSLEKALMMKVIPNERDLMTDQQREIAKEKGDMSWVNTWSFSDVMMSTSALWEHRLAFANALTFIENSMIHEGKIVPIRQYLLQQDRATKYKMSEADRRELERSLDKRVEEMKKTSSLLKSCTFENGKLDIPGVSDREVAKFSLLVTEYFRNLSGQINPDSKPGYHRDTMIHSFFMFKHWIPPLVSQRGRDITKNVVTGEWEYGRTRAFLKTWAHLGLKNVGNMRDIMQGTDKGLKILDDMLEQKRIDYFKKTGQNLIISEEEFYDTMRTAIKNEVKELQALMVLLSLVLLMMVIEPPEDADALEKNRYKYAFKAVNKMKDELSFYYNPISFESFTKGSIIPAVGILSKAERFIESTLKEGAGYAINDDEMIDKSYPLKYFFNLVPGLYQLQSEALPLFFPETAREMGIRVTDQSRRQ